MIKEKDLNIARELREKLSAVVELLDFKVFGSRARGDADEYSDLDVFLKIESLNKEVKEKISAVVWEVGFNNYTVISPLIFTRQEIEDSPLRASSIVLAIFEEGVPV